MNNEDALRNIRDTVDKAFSERAPEMENGDWWRVSGLMSVCIDDIEEILDAAGYPEK